MAVQTKEHILALLRDEHARISALGVKRLGLFGYFVRGQQHPDSDVDVLVEFAPECKTFDNFMQLAFFLEALFDRRVELVTPESLSPYLRPYILREVECVRLALAFVIEGSLSPLAGHAVSIRTRWIIDIGQDTPRFVTAYPQ